MSTEMSAKAFSNINKITEDELSDDLFNLLNKTDLKNQITELSANMNSHLNNQSIHISQEDRNSWDSKAPKNSPVFTGDTPIIPYITELDGKNPNEMTTVEWNTIKSKSVSLESLKKYLSYINTTSGLDHLINFSISGGGRSNVVETNFIDSSSIVLNLTAVDSAILTGTINPSRLSGNYNISVDNSSNLEGHDLTYFAPIYSPTFKGTPTAVTPQEGDSSTKLATTEFVKQELSSFSKVASSSAEKLSTPQRVTITGVVTGEATELFDGTAAINIVATDLDLSKYSDQLFTEEYKTKLEGIEEGANNYIHPSSHPASMITGLHSVATSGNYNELNNLPSIPTRTSELINDSNFVTSEAGGQVESAIKDAAGNIITDTYIKNISISNGDLVYTLGNNTSSTVDIRIPADTIEGLADVATSGSFNDLSDTPSFQDVYASGQYGQVLKINKDSNDIIADDNFHVMRIVDNVEDETNYKQIPGMDMSTIFNSWERFADYNNHFAQTFWVLVDNPVLYADGQNLPDTETLRNKWTFSSADNTIANNGNWQAYAGFISPNKITNYAIKIRTKRVDSDDDIIGIVAAYFTDSSGVHHHISMIRQHKTTNGFMLVYDTMNDTQFTLYDATNQLVHANNSSAPNSYLNVSITKREKSITCQSSVYSSDQNSDYVYSFTWTMPETKPDDWPAEMWNNIQTMMSSEGAQFGVATYSQNQTFTVVSSTGLFTDNKIYNIATNTVYDYIDGTYTSIGTIEDKVVHRSFLYNNDLGKLYFYVQAGEWYKIATGEGSSGSTGGTSDSATNDSIGQNISSTYIKNISFNTESGEFTLTKGNGTSTDLTISLPVSSITGIATVGKTNSYNDLDNKPTIPTKLSELTNDAGYVKADENNEYTLNTIVSDSITSDTIDTDYLTIGDWKLIPTGNGLEIQYQGITKGTITTEGQIKVSELIEK